MAYDRLTLLAPPLWRDDVTMQFGVDSPTRIENPAPWQIEIVMALEHGTTRSELGHLSRRLGVSDAATEFLRHLDDVIIEAASPVRVGVISQGSPTEDDDAREARRALADLPTAVIDDGHPDVVLVIAREVLVPRTCRELMATDTAHVPIVIRRSGVIVGPAIVPGTTACASCLALHETDRDAAWPLLAAQLVARRAEPLGAAVWGEIVRTAARLMAPPPVAESISYELSAMTPPRARRYQLHASCGCQSPAGNATVSAAGGLPLAPMTAPEFVPRA